MTTLDAFAFAGRWNAALPPAAPGGSFRSLLLWPSDGDGWILGRWDGENWCDDQGLIISPPKAWALLPPKPHGDGGAGLHNQVAASVLGDSETAEAGELRRRAEVLAAEYDLPLPPGDAGLIEAERRYAELIRRSGALSREFDLGPEGDQIFEATVYRVENDLWELMGDVVPEGLAGIAVKLRMVREQEADPHIGAGATLGQCIEAVSRLAAERA